MFKKGIALFVTLVLTLALLASCGGGGGTSGATSGGGGTSGATGGNTGATEPKTANIAMSENPVGLDPHYTSQLGLNTVRDMIWERLVYFREMEDGTVEYIPQLATEWEYSDDGLTWTFKLREGVTFHNGEEFTSADCVATWQRLADNPDFTLSSSFWGELDSFRAVDDYTFEIVLKNPVATMLMSIVETVIFPDEALAESGEDYITQQLLYGTGKWVFEEWVDGQYVHFTKNENYWDDSWDSYYDDLYLRFITEESTAIASLLAGDIKLYARSGGITANSLQLFEGRDDIELVNKAMTANMYFGLQCGADSIFSDKNARLAFSYAIDRESIIANILGDGVVPNSFIVSGLYGYDDTMPALEYNPDKARELLAQTDYDGYEIMLSSNTGTTQSSEILLAVSEMLNEVGFNTTTQIVEGPTLLEMRVNGEYDVFLVNTMIAMSDPGFLITQRALNDYHKSEYVNPELNDLIEKSNSELDHEKRIELLKQVNHILTEEMAPFVCLVQNKQTNAIYKGVTGVEFNVSGQFSFMNISYDASQA